MFSCSFGGLNYPDVAFDNLPLLGFADYRFRRRRLRWRSSTDRGGDVDGHGCTGRHDSDGGPSPAADELRARFADNGGRGERGAGRVPEAAVSNTGMGGGGEREEATASAAAAAAAAEEAVGDGEVDYDVSPYGPIGRLFARLCPDLGAYVAPWLNNFAGEFGLSPRDSGGRLAGSEGRVKVVFISSRFGNHGPTKALAGLMRLLPRDYFEVWSDS